MITLFGKKRINASRLSNIFINSIIQSVEEGFEDVAALINESTEFIENPQIDKKDDKEFLLIVLSANISLIPEYFHNYKDRAILEQIYAKLTHVFEMNENSVEKLLKDYISFMKRANHPSRNMVYAMSKAMFYKYDLGKYQEEYFRNMNCPNPILLKRLDNAMESFLWNWEAFKANYSVSE